MPRNKGVLLVSLFLLSIFLVPAAPAQDEQGYVQDQLSDIVSHARIVRLSHIEGTVQIDNDRGFENATVNMPITEGDRLLARSDGWTEVQFEDGSTVRLAPDTQITFSQLGRNAEGGTVTAIDLDQGEAEFTVKKPEGSDFAVTVRNKTIFLRHSGRFRVTATNANPLEIVVWKGDVAVADYSTGAEVAVRAKETFVLDPNDMEQYNLEKSAMADDLDEWSQQRDDYLKTYASSGGNYTQSPYQYGANDLNYYGTYYDVPGYGYLWQPTGLGLGWDPYTNGYWSWSPIYGYCWVSAYPWGWMPYRYGRWIFLPGRGWMWQPGNWQGWWLRPRITNPPHDYRPPRPPGGRVITGRPGVPPPVAVKPPPSRPAPAPGQAGPPSRRPGDYDGRFQVPRTETDRGQRGRRVFTSEEIQDRVPRRDTSGAPSGAIRMEPREPQAPAAGQPGTGTVQPREGRPGEVPRQPAVGQRAPEVHERPAPVPQPSVRQQPPEPVRERPAPIAVPRQQPPEPAVREHPAPAQVPRQQPPSAPVTQPAPAPRLQPPPAAPRAETPPAPRVSAPPPAPPPHVSSPPQPAPVP
ncbi:MAG TPA: DUF6600 domain-containing protein, partial [Candidatus Angelobacter sp.]